MKKIKKYILLIMICLILVLGFNYKNIVKADSGWDYSYDSGGSSYHNSRNKDGKKISSKEDVITILLFFSFSFAGIFCLYAFIIPGIDKKKQKQKLKENNINISLKELKKNVFEIYKKIEIAKCNFDYTTIKKYTTEKLYSIYKFELDEMISKKEKNIIKDIKYVKSEILDIKLEDNIVIVEILLKVKSKKYIIDKNNKIIKGSNEFFIEENFNIKLNIYTSTNKCQICNASIKNKETKCPYCDSNIISNNKFIISSQECTYNKLHIKKR